MWVRGLVLLVFVPVCYDALDSFYEYDEEEAHDDENTDFYDSDDEDNGSLPIPAQTPAAMDHTRVRRFGALEDRVTLNPQEIKKVKVALKGIRQATWTADASSKNSVPNLYEYFEKSSVLHSEPVNRTTEISSESSEMSDSLGIDSTQDTSTLTFRPSEYDSSAYDRRNFGTGRYTSQGSSTDETVTQETATLGNATQGNDTDGIAIENTLTEREATSKTRRWDTAPTSKGPNTALGVLRTRSSRATYWANNTWHTYPNRLFVNGSWHKLPPGWPFDTTHDVYWDEVEGKYKKRTTTVAKPVTLKMDVEALMDLIANLTYYYDMNLTERFNQTLVKYSVPTCGTYTTTEPTSTPISYNFANTSIVGKCFVCGMDDEEIPRNAHCADAFAGDFLPLVPVDNAAKGQIARYRKYCRYLDVNGYMYNEDEPRAVYGRFTGGCSVRWTDLTGVYTQRSCRNRRRAVMGRHFASQRMAKLEMSLHDLDNGCIASPMATLLPLSRGISLYSRFHACVCTGAWCNSGVQNSPWIANLLVSLWFHRYT